MRMKEVDFNAEMDSSRLEVRWLESEDGYIIIRNADNPKNGFIGPFDTREDAEWWLIEDYFSPMSSLNLGPVNDL